MPLAHAGACAAASGLAVLVLVWIADTAAYFVGRAWGRRKLAPAISPGKTWEGAAGGVVGALAYAIILAAFAGHIDWAPWLAGAATPVRQRGGPVGLTLLAHGQPKPSAPCLKDALAPGPLL